jgi:histidine triad (HIT) family protein
MSHEDCVFCQIIEKRIASDMIYEDDDLVAFKDIDPKAPTHILIVPKKHISRIVEVDDEDAPLLGKMIVLAKDIAKENNFHENGFRITLNDGRDGGQTIFHIHMHLLSGRRLMWPPG